MSIVHNLFPTALHGGRPLVACLLAIGGFLFARRLRDGIRRLPPFRERVLIIGGTLLAREIIAEIEAGLHVRYSILGVVNDAMPGEPPVRCQYLGPLEHISKIIKETHPDRIIVALAERRHRLPVSQLLLASVCDGILVEDGLEVYERLTGRLALEALTPGSLVFDKNFQKSHLTLAAGRAVSLVASVVGLVCLAPLLGLIALMIKLDSRGPVFYVHERVGAGGRPFKLVKFRTMRPEQKTPLWYQENHSRITRVGKWLRKFRLDELPQFLNVLRGDMNLVGPRPQRVPKFELLSLVARNIPESGQAIPYFFLRSRFRPGMTGWAQVRYHYAHTLEEELEKLRYDLYYIKHMSLWFDLRILFETVKLVFLGRGSSEAADRQSKRREDEAAEADLTRSPGGPDADRHLSPDQTYASSSH